MSKKPLPLTDEDYLREAQGPSGCHANTDEALAACARLVERGVIYEGPFKNSEGRPVFFAHERVDPPDADRRLFESIRR